MEAEALEERSSPAEVKRLGRQLEVSRETFVSAAEKEAGLRKRQVTVGRTPLGECLRQLSDETQEELEKEAEGVPEEGHLLFNLLEKSLKLIERIELLREREAQKKKRKKSLGPRLEAAKQDGRGGKNKTVPPRRREGLTGGPQEEQQQPQHLHPPLAPEEEGRQASDPQKSEAVDVDRWPGDKGEAQDCGGEEGDKKSEENSEDVCSDEGDSDHSEDSEDNSDVSDSDDEGKEKSARCYALYADMDELEEKVDVMQNVSQEEVDALYVKLGDFDDVFWDIAYDVKYDLSWTVIPLWSAVWNAPLQAVRALQKALNRPLAVELTALKKESDSLSGFLQTIKGHDTEDKFSVLCCLPNVLQDFALIKMGLPYGVLLNEEDALKQRRDTWYSTLLHVLLKQGQEMVGNLQEKVDALQNISLKQVDILNVKIGAVQKQMGALWKVPLKEMMILVAMVHELSSALFSGSSEEMNTLWRKARDQVFTLKTCKGDAFQELHPLWEKLDALLDALCHISIKKLMVLKEKEEALRRKVATLQNNLWNSLEKELQLLKDKLYSLRDPSLKELEEELDELQSTLDKIRYDWDYPLQEKVGTLQKEMDALQKKIDARQKTNAPLKEVEEVMEMERSSFSETLKAPEAGAEQINVHGRITDQPANIVAKMAVPSSFEATKNAGRSSGSTGNLRGSVSTSVPSSSAGVRKVWHGEVTLEERHRLVYKFADAISPGNDSVAAREKLVAYTKQIEEDMFELANSKVEYHDLVAGKLDAIQKKLDQNLRSSLPNQGTSNDQPDLQASWTHPGNIPRVAGTAGQKQPLILPRGSQWDHTSASSVQTSQPQIASSVPSSVNHPVQMNNVASVSVGQVSGAVLPSSLNTLEHQNSHLPCIPVTQPSIHYPLPSPSTVVGLPPTQCQQPLGMTPLPSQAPALLSIPASLSELHPTPVAGSVPDALHVQGTPWEETSNGSTLPSPNGASDTRMVPTSADPTTTPPCSSGSQPAAGKRPFSGVEAAEKASVALPIPETTNLNRSKTQDPQQPEEAMCAESSEDSFADCEPTLTETEPPHKKQKVDPVERIQMATLAQELYAAHQKYVKYVTDTVTQNMEKVGDLMGRLHGPPKQNSALKDIEDAKALTSALKKALALLKCFLEDS